MSNELCHYGKKGMKWGVRRGSDSPIKMNKRQSDRQKQNDELSKMSDAELRKHINRKKMEQEYKQLNAPNTSVGKQFVKSTVANAGKQVATQYTAKYMGLGIAALISYGMKKVK